MMSTNRLELSRAQILAHRRRVGALEERLPAGQASLEHAALGGLQDSMPRAALLSIHARVQETEPSTWENPALVQIWGPRFAAYVIAARDLALFTLGRLPDETRGRQRAEDTAARLNAFLAGRRMRYDEAGLGLGLNPNALRYAGQTGTVLIRWEGARLPVIWTVPRPETEPAMARLELARRYVHVFGPTTAASFATWAGISTGEGLRAFVALAAQMTHVLTPIGEALVLSTDEPSFLADPLPPALARLLPSGDPYYLLQGADRDLLLPDARHRPMLWTPRVWPGALLVGGEIIGVWRRANALVQIDTWRRVSAAERQAIEEEAVALPLPGLNGAITVRWTNETH